MMRDVPLFEVKAHLSAIVRRIKETGEEVVITVRGEPAARIVPAVDVPSREDAWVVRERVVGEYGIPDYKDPPEPVGGIKDLFSDELE